MTRTGRILAAVRPAALVAAGAFAVHELSYLAGAEAHAVGDHSYLAAVLPAVAVLVALALFTTVERGVAGASGRPASPLTRILAYAAGILALFFIQEAVEGLVAGDDPLQVGVLVVARGVVAVPLALCLGVLAWLAARGLEAVEGRIATRFEQPAARRTARSGLRPRWLDVVLSPPLLASGAAARAPPAI